MFEFIGMAVVGWIGFLIVGRLWFKFVGSRNEKLEECKEDAFTYAAFNLGVPLAYCKYALERRVPQLIETTYKLKRELKNPDLSECMGCAIYLMFRGSCEVFSNEAQIRALFDELDVDESEVEREMKRDMMAVLRTARR